MSLSQRIVSATAQLTLSNALLRLLSLISMPILTRLLSPDAYGAAAMAGTVISLVSVVALSGMDMSYARAYHAKLPPSGQVVECFAWRYALGTGLLAACISAIAWWLVIADAFDLPRYLAGLLGVGILLSIANTMALQRARLNNLYRSMSLSIVASGLGTAAVSIGVALWWRQDELPLILSIVVGYLIPVVMLGIPSIGMLGKASGLKQNERVGVFKIGLAGMVTAPMYWVLSSLDRWILGYFEDAASVGIYTIGYSVAITGMMVNNAIISVWLPEASREYEKDPEAARVQLGVLAGRLVGLLAIVWLAITAGGGDAVRLLAGPRFHEAATVVPFIALGVFFYGVLHLANASLLLMKKLNYAMWWWLAGAALCLLLNLILVPMLGRFGAAVTQAISFAFIAAGIVYSAQKAYPIKVGLRRLGLLITGTFVLGAIMQPAWASTSTQSLLLKFPVGLAMAFLVFKSLAPEVMRAIVGRFLGSKTTQG
jgi:O-antigen/teichoic acid export membrane protein